MGDRERQEGAGKGAGVGRCPTVTVLSEDDARRIHAASLEILSSTGIVMQSGAGRRLLEQCGAREDDGRVKIPPEAIGSALNTVPKGFTLWDRTGAAAMELRDPFVYFGPGSDTTFTVDLETGERRLATASDVTEMARLADALPNLDFVMSMGVPSDVASADIYLHEFVGMVRGSSMSVVFTAADTRDVEDIARIAAGCVGSEAALAERPFLMIYAEPISPLLFPASVVDKTLRCAELGIPVAFPPSPNLGGGGPVTLAGSIALGNAENLAGLLLTQQKRAGAPFLYGYNLAALDMRSVIVSYGAPEWALGMAAVADMGRFYGLPSWGYAGATDAKAVDAQAGLEGMLSVVMALLCRSTLVHDVGYIEYGSTSSAEMIVAADEMIAMARYVVGGVRIDENALALDAIADVTPGKGFLDSDHTLANWRSSLFLPRMLDRRRYESWCKDGRPDMYSRANRRARDILSSHEPEPLPAAAEAVIEDVLAERGRTTLE